MIKHVSGRHLMKIKRLGLNEQKNMFSIIYFYFFVPLRIVIKKEKKQTNDG